MTPDMASYQIKAVCKRCGKIISPKVDRIKTHRLKCVGGEDVGEYEEIASLVRYRVKDDKTDGLMTSNKLEKVENMNASDELENAKNTGYVAPHKRYGVGADKWDQRYGDDSGIIDYEKYPHKRYRSETKSEDSDESPAYKRNDMGLDNDK